MGRLRLAQQRGRDAPPVQARRARRPGQLGERRQDVPERPDEVRPSAGRHDARPTRHRGRPDAALVEAPLVPPEAARGVEELGAVAAALEVRAVVRGEDDEGAVVDAQTIQASHQVADLAVHVGDGRRMVLLHVRPRLVLVLQVRRHRRTVLRGVWSILPTAGVRHREAEIQEEGPGASRYILQPRHRAVVEHVGGVVVLPGMGHAQLPAPLPPVP
mmetsp:Transcript_48534/g.136549  ORF Transcript_48534/g.136549 Transcript_48534/m.136549 type:complete len:216 (-) Transcript_48534:185-832(-)